MDKPFKKILVFLIVLAAVIVIGVAAMLLWPDGGGPGTVSSPPPAETAASGSPAASPGDEGTIERQETDGGTAVTVTVPGGRAVYSFAVTGDTLGIGGKSDDILLTAEAHPDDFINITFAEGGEAALLAPKIMDRYIKYNRFEQSGQNYIPGTEIAGETVAAGDGSTEVRAWLVNTEGGVLAVVLQFGDPDDKSRTDVLYDVLKTFRIGE